MIPYWQDDSITLYHGVRTEADLYARKALLQRAAEHCFQFIPVLAQDRIQGVRAGHLHEALGEDIERLDAARLYVCGPPPMVDAVRCLARERGARDEHFRADAFFAAPKEKQGLWERISGWGALAP